MPCFAVYLCLCIWLSLSFFMYRHQPFYLGLTLICFIVTWLYLQRAHFQTRSQVLGELQLQSIFSGRKRKLNPGQRTNILRYCHRPQKWWILGVPWWPVARSPGFQCCGPGSNPGLETGWHCQKFFLKGSGWILLELNILFSRLLGNRCK